jgi:hemerythrin superfamily protein
MTTHHSTTRATDLLRRQHQQVKETFSQLEQAAGEQRAELFDCLRRTLAVHETAEEIVIHPAGKLLGAEVAKIVESRLSEEAQAKRELADLEKLGPDGDGFGVKLLAFRRMVEGHAGAEEAELFPVLEARLDADELGRMGDEIEIAEAMAPTHPHPHGPTSGIGNQLVGPFVAMVDKVRDKLAKAHAH